MTAEQFNKGGCAGRMTAGALAFGMALFASVSVPALAQAQAASVPSAQLEEGFRNPPDSAKPRVWWHWLSGNVAKPGIALDLAWMKRVGLGGMQMFDGDMGAPKIVDQRVAALSPEWKEHLRFTAEEADRLGLEFAMAAAPGWSETGGPWVKPEAGMKKLVWAETRVAGGRQFEGALNAPPRTVGPFQDIPKPGSGNIEPFYRDIAVLAFRQPKGDVTLAALKPTITASFTGDLGRLVDGKFTAPLQAPGPTPSDPLWVRFDFDRPQTMRALTMVGPQAGRFNTAPEGRVEASDDGLGWRTVAALTGPAHNPAPARTYAFPATTARYFRVIFNKPPVSAQGYASTSFALAELALVPGARVNHFEDKAGFGVAKDQAPTGPAERGAVVNEKQVLDLTSRLRPDGTLDWRPGAGDWIVLRLGYSLTGQRNHPATPEATGLEADKFDAEHVRDHLQSYLQPVIDALGPLTGKRGLQYILTDSWEAGVANWTDRMQAEFQRRRGYDPTPWLPVLTGRVVESAEASDKFLWDYRRTLADLVAENHYGTITAYAKQHGLGYYGEAVGASWPTVADGMQAKSYTDIPMGEFWAMPFGAEPASYQGVPSDEFPADIAETASTAHVYGKSLVAAEALTSSQPLWTTAPWNLKWVADKYMAMGVNRLVIHTSPHQPGAGNAPGLALGPFGQTFTRHETWGEMAEPWIRYLSRTSFMLQQGTNVADIAYFYGEGAPSGVPYGRPGGLHVPEGYAADFINADALLRLASVRDGRIVLPGGASYRVLVLPASLDRMTLPLAEKLRELVKAGATIVGPRPTGSPSLGDGDDAVRAVAAELWGRADGRTVTVNTLGAGKVYWGPQVEEVLKAEGVVPDFGFERPTPATKVVFNHRRLPDGDLYFVANQTGAAEKLSVDLRVIGREVEIWRADTGAITPAGYEIGQDRTRTNLELSPYEAVFLVLRRPATAAARPAPAVPVRRIAATLDGPWGLAFQPDRGAPARITLPRLGSWTEASDPGVKYFSGVGTYSRTIEVPAAWLAGGGRVLLNLGEVKEVAEVRLNGTAAGVAWKPPYEVDVTEALRPGRNTLEIRVANLWRNRIVGDAQPGATKVAITSSQGGGGFSFGPRIGKDTPLLPSGLLGPVTVQIEDKRSEVAAARP